MKDVNDKFGDFMQTGGGEMADFFERSRQKSVSLPNNLKAYLVRKS